MMCVHTMSVMYAHVVCVRADASEAACGKPDFSVVAVFAALSAYVHWYPCTVVAEKLRWVAGHAGWTDMPATEYSAQSVRLKDSVGDRRIAQAWGHIRSGGGCSARKTALMIALSESCLLAPLVVPWYGSPQSSLLRTRQDKGVLARKKYRRRTTLPGIIEPLMVCKRLCCSGTESECCGWLAGGV